MSKADVGLWKFPWNAMECWVSSQSSQTLPDLPGYNTEYNQSRIFRMAHMDVYVSIYIYMVLSTVYSAPFPLVI